VEQKIVRVVSVVAARLRMRTDEGREKMKIEKTRERAAREVMAQAGDVGARFFQAQPLADGAQQDS